MIDFGTFNQKKASELGYTCAVVNPSTGLAEKDMWFKVRGAHSAAVKSFDDEVMRTLKLKEDSAKRRGDNGPVVSQADADEISLRRAEAVLMEWGGFKMEGKDVGFPSPEASVILANNPWLRDQIVTKAYDSGNFLVNSSAS